jgi:hypothetical protein
MMLRARTLWLFGVTLPLGAILGLGAGCGDGGSDARIAVNWSVAYVGPEATTCEAAGTPTVHLDARRSGSSQVYSFDFDCTPLNGVTDTLAPGTYEISLSLLDLKKRPVAFTSGTFDIHRHGPTELTPVQFQVQAFQVSWLLVLKAANNAMSTPPCAAFGVKTVEFSAQLSTESAGETFRFDCTENPGLGMTSAIRTGNYAYQFRLLDAADKPLTEGDIKPLVVGGTQLAVVPSERFEFQ